MAQFVVRNLEDDVRERLRELSLSQGQSMEEIVREILRNAVLKWGTSPPRLGSQMAKRFSKVGLDFEIDELRGQHMQPPSLDP